MMVHSDAAGNPINVSPIAQFPFAGFAIPLLVTLTLWLPNMKRVPYEDAIPTILSALGVAILGTLLLRVTLKSWTRSGIIIGIFFAYLLYAPSVFSFFSRSDWLVGVGLLLSGLIVLHVAMRIPREEEALLEINRKLNLILIPLTLAIGGVATVQQIVLELGRPQTQIFPQFKGVPSADSPDIWHLVFDRYANSETLKRVYGYDNRHFLDALRARGFTLNNNAFSNYQRTGHSVASTLNGSYLDPLIRTVSSGQDDWVPIYRTLTANQALRFFNAAGYETVFAGSWWNPTRKSSLADVNVNYRALPELGRLLLNQSVLGFALRQLDLPYGNERVDQCNRARYKFARLREIATTQHSKQKYVFAHFLVPHPPFVLNANGSCRMLEVAESASRRDNYLQQIEYTNREILALIDAILSGSTSATIVIHSDEGPWPEPHVGDERFLGRDPVTVDWNGLDDSRLREKMGILMAVRYAGTKDFSAPTSPINIYPQILRKHFASLTPNLDTRHQLFRSNAMLYTFDDVTVRLRKSPEDDR